MNPMLLMKAAPWLVGAVLAAMLAAMTYLYMGERDALAVEKTKFDAFVATVEREGREAEAEKSKTEVEHKQNLVQIRKDNETQLNRVRADAVANYLAHAGVRQRAAANSGGGSLSRNGSGIKVDDGAITKCVPDSTFIADAADDALKLGAWQQYCTLNHCPVE